MRRHANNERPAIEDPLTLSTRSSPVSTLVEDPPDYCFWTKAIRGVQSGATGTQSGAAVIQLRDGMIVSYRSYLRREGALEAVGLRA